MSLDPQGNAMEGGSLPSSRSIYRGHSMRGIGEDPTSVSAHGQQYLASDPELWNAALPDELRAWMTMDDRAQDRWTLGEKMEAWSYLPVGNLIFVVRLAAAGTYRDRTVYFSHGRAWQAADCRDGFDPGALIGWSQAFDRPWRDGRPARGEGYPGDKSALEFRQRSETVWKSAVRNEPVVATQILAHLLAACTSGCPLVIAVPVGEFVVDSPLYHLVAFARAALPEPLKKNCRMRLYTSDPGKALSKWKCDLVVIPEDLAPDALSARRDILLLDRSGRAVSGRRVETGYAKAAVERMGTFPASIFAFSARMARTPELVSSDAVSMVYNLAAVFPSESGDAFERSVSAELQKDRDGLLRVLNRAARKRAEVMPWSQLIDAGEWQRFSTAAINDVAFPTAPVKDAALSETAFKEVAYSRVESPDARALRGAARAALASNRQLDRDKLPGWWETVDDELRLEELRELIASGVITTPEDISFFLIDLTAAQIKILLREPFYRDSLAAVSGKPKWAKEVADSVENLPEFVKLAELSLFWRAIAFEAIARFVDKPQALPDLGACFVELDGLPFPADQSSAVWLDEHLLLAEALDRTANAGASRARVQRLRDVATPEQQRTLLAEKCNEERWGALRKYLSPTPSWYANAGDLILQRPELVENLSVPDLLTIAQGVAHFPPVVLNALNKQMRMNRRECTHHLREGRAWLRWRLKSFLDPRELRDCAIEWLYAECQTPPMLEEWKQVCRDIGALTQGDLEGLLREKRPPGERTRYGEKSKQIWPFIPLFREVQIEDLAQACPDLGMVAFLAESIDEKAPPYESVLQTPKFRGFPAKFLGLLAPSARYDQIPWQEYDWNEIKSLYDQAGHRQPEARRAAAYKVVTGMNAELVHAQETYHRCQLQGYPFFWDLVESGLCRPEFFEKKALEWLDANVTRVKDRQASERLGVRADAKGYRDAGYKNLGRFLWPDLRETVVTDAPPAKKPSATNFGAILEALRRKDANAPSLSELMESANTFQTGFGVHPFLQLAEAVRKSAGSEGHPADRKQWNTFREASLRYGQSNSRSGFLRDSDSLLVLACELHPGGLSEIAVEVAIMASDLSAGARSPALQKDWYQEQSWWQGLIEGIWSCSLEIRHPGRDERGESAVAALFRLMDAATFEPRCAWELREWVFLEWERRNPPNRTLGLVQSEVGVE